VRFASVVVAGALLLAGCSAGSQSGRGAVAVPDVASTGSATSLPPASPVPAAASTMHASDPVAPARAVTTPCTTNTRPQWVFVSLRRQHLWMCARSRVVRDAPITSGMRGQYTETPTGSYAIQGLNRNTYLTLITGQTYAVKYWIPFDAPLFGFHDSSWQDFPYGTALYETRGSHGCVHVPLAAIRFLFRWAHVGTPVRIKA